MALRTAVLPEGSVPSGYRQEFPEKDRLDFSEPAGSPTHLSISCLLSGVHGCGYRCLNDGLLRLLSFRGARSARRIAFRAGITVWIAAPPVAQSLRSAAGITHKSARPSAALLARLPAIPWLRSLLRRLEPPGERQTTLL